MPMTEQDARALAYLAGRLREETYGANKWDAPGIWAEVSPLVGQNLAVSIERVTRHAADPEAKTPGAIRRPYTPGPPAPTHVRDVAPVGSRCTTCGRTERDCRRDDHEFTRPIPRDVDLEPVVAELKGLARAELARVPHTTTTPEESK